MPESPAASSDIPLTQKAHAAIAPRLTAGDIAIDATAGNGYDTLFLARCVVPAGQVYAFDIQAAAIAATQNRLAAAQLTGTVTLQQANHAELRKHIPRQHWGKIRTIMFNLGYLPHGDKSIITQPASTLAALEASLTALAPHGILSIILYSGHPGGVQEAAAVHDWLAQINPTGYTVDRHSAGFHKSSAPVLVLLERK